MMHGKNVKPGDGETNCELLTSGHDVTVAQISSQQLGTPVQAQHNIKSVKIPA